MTLLYKAEPVGPPWALTWSARRAPQHFSPVPPPSLSADSSEARSCETSDPMATCTFVSHKRTQSLRIVTMSPTRLLATFVDDETEAGTAVVIKVVQHLPDKWEFNTGVKVVFSEDPTSNVDVAALSASSAVIAFADESSKLVKAVALTVSGTGTDDVTLGTPTLIGEGNLTANEENYTDCETTDTSNPYSDSHAWRYTATHRRVSVCALSATRALVGYGPICSTAEVVLVFVSGVDVTKAVALQLRSSNIDDLKVVPLGSTKKAVAVYRDEDV